MNKDNKGNINIREIARLAGVSVASVSRALQDKPTNKLSAGLRARILEICEKFQYYPNIHTVRMFSHKANTVAFIFPSFINGHDDFDKFTMDPNLGACIKGAEDILSANSIYLSLASITDKFLQKKEFLKIFRSRMVDGMIVWGWIENEAYLYELIDEKVPLVMVQTEAAQTNTDKVVADDYRGMVSITEYVISKGHKKIAVVSPPLEGSAGSARFKGIMDTLGRTNIKPR